MEASKAHRAYKAFQPPSEDADDLDDIEKAAALEPQLEPAPQRQWLVTCVPYRDTQKANKAATNPEPEKSSSPRTHVAQRKEMCVYCHQEIKGTIQWYGSSPVCKSCYPVRVPLMVRGSIFIIESYLGGKDHMDKIKKIIQNFPSSWRIEAIIDQEVCGIVLYERPRTPIQE